MIGDSVTMCKASQTITNQTSGFPRLQTSPGDKIALGYQENGHVTEFFIQAGKPSNRGTVYIYATTAPKDTEIFNSIHKVWTTDGKGGDKRGILLAAQNFDDGQCYQTNPSKLSVERQAKFPVAVGNGLMGPNLWCQNNVMIPLNAPVNKPYTLYWVWDWPTAAGADGPGTPGKNETYTTCMDVDMVASSSNKALDSASFEVTTENRNQAAVPDYFTQLQKNQNIVVQAPSDGSVSSTTGPTESPSASASTTGSTTTPPGTASADGPQVTVYPISTVMTTATMVPSRTPNGMTTITVTPTVTITETVKASGSPASPPILTTDSAPLPTVNSQTPASAIAPTPTTVETANTPSTKIADSTPVPSDATPVSSPTVPSASNSNTFAILPSSIAIPASKSSDCAAGSAQKDSVVFNTANVKRDSDSLDPGGKRNARLENRASARFRNV